MKIYSGKFPKAKSLVLLPMADFNSVLTVDGKNIKVEHWIGSQNHNWGSRHTDLYAWGQVAGFDDNPDSFLEVAAAQLKIGPVWTPKITPVVLRHKGEEFRLNGLCQTLKAFGRFTYFDRRFESSSDKLKFC